jgi:rhamnosyltransferase
VYQVHSNGAVYFSKEDRSLSSLVNEADGYSQEDIMKLSVNAKERIRAEYSWEKIIKDYEDLFLNS